MQMSLSLQQGPLTFIPQKPLTLALHFDQEMVYYNDLFQEIRAIVVQCKLKMEQIKKEEKENQRPNSPEDQMYNNC